MNKRIIANLLNQTFERWTVLAIAEKRKGMPYWLCRCDCGTVREVGHYQLIKKGSKSCGCLKREVTIKRSTKHGCNTVKNGPTPEYMIWIAMKARCGCPTNKNYSDYGGRGIRVCERWLNSFANFLADMGPRPEGFTLDRIDNFGDYEPSNCQWRSRSKQARNKRNNRYITYNGQTLSLPDWAELIGIPTQRLHDRLFKLGWTMERALTK